MAGPVRHDSPMRKRPMSLRDALGVGLLERSIETRLVLLAACAGEHVLVLGPPGTAKSELARRLKNTLVPPQYFERLMTRFTVPEELSGPYSIKALEDGRYERLTAGYCPTSTVAFLDEVFKANSAILNALLTLMNEREFDNGAGRTKGPLITLIGASNELPEGDELAALEDRFLLRLFVRPVSSDNFGALLRLDEQARMPHIDDPLSHKDLGELRAVSSGIHVPDDVVQLLSALRAHCETSSIAVSDRRWRKIVALLRVAAFCDGRDKVSSWDAWIVPYCIGRTSEQQAELRRWFDARIAAGAGGEDATFERIVSELEARLEKERSARAQQTDALGKPLYRAAGGQLTTRIVGDVHARNKAGELLYHPPDARRSPSRRRTPDAPATYDEETELKVLAAQREPNGLNHEQLRAQLSRYGWDFDTYIKEPSNSVLHKARLEPAIAPLRYSDAHIEGRLKLVREQALLLQRFRGWIDASPSEAPTCPRRRLRANTRRSRWPLRAPALRAASSRSPSRDGRSPRVSPSGAVRGGAWVIHRSAAPSPPSVSVRETNACRATC